MPPDVETPPVPEAPAAPASITPPSTEAAPLDDWRAAHLPEELKGEAVFGKYKSLPDALKAHVALSKQQGGSISVPKEGAPQEEWDRVYAKLGRPERPDGYQIAMPEQMPSGMTKLSDERLGSFRAAAHAAGMSQAQVNAAAKWFMEDQAQNHSGVIRTVEEGRAAAVEQLKKDWGPLFERNRGLAIAAFDRFGQETDRAAFDEKYGDDPVALRFLAAIGEQLMEKGEITGESAGVMSVQSAQEKLNEILAARIADKAHPLNNPKHPQYEQLLAETRALRSVAVQGMR